jgi:hypothetical protein
MLKFLFIKHLNNLIFLKLKMSVNAKQLLLHLRNKPRLPEKIKSRPRYLRKYPNLSFEKNDIIDVEYKLKEKIKFSEITDKRIKLNLKQVRTYTYLKKVM